MESKYQTIDNLLKKLEETNNLNKEFSNENSSLKSENRKLNVSNNGFIQDIQILKDEREELENMLKKCRKRNYTRPTVSWINGTTVNTTRNECSEEKKEIEDLKLLEKVTKEQFEQEMKIMNKEKEDMQLAFDLAVKKASEETEKAEKELRDANVEMERLVIKEKLRVEKEEKEENMLLDRLSKTKSPSEIASIHREIRLRKSTLRTPTIVPRSNEMGYECANLTQTDSSKKDISRSCEKVLGGPYKTIGECRLDCVKPGHVESPNSQ